MLIALTLILITLILIFCGDKGSKSIITTVGNSLLMLIAIFAIYRGLNPVLVTLTMSILASCLILFYQNEISEKSKIAFVSTVIVLVAIIPLVFFLAHGSNSHGFNNLEYEITDSNGYSRNIGINMMAIQISVMIVALIGAVVDAAVAVNSSMYEIYNQDKTVSKPKLIESGFNVGNSILSTSMHTIFYIYIAEYMTLMMQYVEDYTFVKMLNSKSFAQGFLSITVCGIGCCLIVPVTIYITAKVIYRKDAVTAKKRVCIIKSKK